nr:MAG TPA: hypothetical protein [Bacteriophage sp.]
MQAERDGKERMHQGASLQSGRKPFIIPRLSP